MSLKLQRVQKQSLHLSLKQWIPILQAPLSELENIFKEKSYENPFLEYQSSFESSISNSTGAYREDGKRGFIENNSIYSESLYDKISNQIYGHLFPTPNSVKVALEILTNINTEGYFEGSIENIALKCKTTNDFVQSVRKRFAHLEPYGVGALNLEESFQFQLDQLDIDDELYELVSLIIKNIKKIDKYCKHHRFNEATYIIQHFNTPPAIEFISDQPYVIPEFTVEVKDDIKLIINNDYYPDVTVSDPFKSKNAELKDKIKEARDLIDYKIDLNNKANPYL
jgi:RNA polymerase sigma-54 factor